MDTQKSLNSVLETLEQKRSQLRMELRSVAKAIRGVRTASKAMQKTAHKNGRK